MLGFARIEGAGFARLIIGFALGLSGCGSKDNRSLVRDPVEYIKASCDYTPDEGTDYPATQTSSPIAPGYFGKPYNRDWLMNVGHTSMRDTAAYIQTTGAKVYYSSALSQKSCKNFNFTASMPPDLAHEWQKVDYRGTNGEFVSGLYLIRGTRDLNSLKSKAAVIIREDANRWTLVHEFMHHNFKSQAVLRGYNDDVTQAQALAMAKEIDETLHNSKLSNRDKVRKATPIFLDFIEVVDRLVIQYTFEEIAVEAMLQDKYDSGDLTYVPAGQYANATWYIQHSKGIAQSLYASLDGPYKALRDLATFSGGRYKEYFQLDKHIEFKEKRLDQLDAMLTDRATKHFNATSFLGMEIATPETSSMMGSAPCGGAIQTEENVGLLTEAIRRITR